MRIQPLVVLALVLGAVVAPHAQAKCAHLLVDPAGDVDPTSASAPVDDPKQVDILWTELSTKRTTITATIRVADLNPESQPVRDRSYTVGFSTNGQRYELQASFNRGGNGGEIWHIVTGDPPDSGPSAEAGQGIGPAVGAVDIHRDVVTITADRSDFDATGGLRGSLTKVGSSTWTGFGAEQPPLGETGTYGSADFGSTTKPYRLGAASCSA